MPANRRRVSSATKSCGFAAAPSRSMYTRCAPSMLARAGPRDAAVSFTRFAQAMRRHPVPVLVPVHVLVLVRVRVRVREYGAFAWRATAPVSFNGNAYANVYVYAYVYEYAYVYGLDYLRIGEVR